MSADPDLYRLTASEAVRRLKNGDVSPTELVAAALERIEQTEPQINAMPTLCAERAHAHAQAIEQGKRPAGLLGGLPIAVKDLNNVAGVRCTFGSPIYADFVPDRSDIMVERLEQNGAIVIGKSNTPEFGAGASTFNEVFGITRNPWNTEKSVAGSSGGSAAALAAGQVWLATGSDLGGSLRTPASFNGVIGLRPSPGRVLSGPRDLAWNTLPVCGPMARTAADCALMLDALCADGIHPEDPLTRDAPAVSFSASLDAPQRPTRIGYSTGLGIVEVDTEVNEICQAAALRFAEFGTKVESACPDFSLAPDTFQTLRATMFAAAHQNHLRDHRDKLKADVIWNIEKGLRLTAAEIGKAEQARSQLYRNVESYFRDFDLLLCPTSIVPPFNAEERYVKRVNDHQFDNYIDWLRLAFAATLTSCPAISVPAGITRSGLPVGLQIIAPPYQEARVLAAAAMLDSLVGLSNRVPLDPQLGNPNERLA